MIWCSHYDVGGIAEIEQGLPDISRAANDRNDEVLEHTYGGFCFKNDTERLEKLFDMYTKMTTKVD